MTQTSEPLKLDFQEKAFKTHTERLAYVLTGPPEIVETIEEEVTEKEVGVIASKDDLDKIAAGDGDQVDKQVMKFTKEGYEITKEIYTCWKEESPVIVAFRNRPKRGMVRMFFVPKVEFYKHN